MRENTIGIDLGGTKMLLYCQGVHERIETGSAFTPNDLLHQLKRFVASNRLSPKRIGIAVPGLVDAEGAVLASDVLPLFSGWKPKPDMAALNLRWSVLNDVKAALLEEMQLGMLEQARSDRDARTFDVSSIAEAREAASTGFARIPWAALADGGIDQLAKEAITVRCLQSAEGGLAQSDDEPGAVALVARSY